MDIDFSIRIGDLLTIVSIASGDLIVFTQMRSESKANRERLDKVDVELVKQTGILTQLAAGEASMNGLDRCLQLLEDARR